MMIRDTDKDLSERKVLKVRIPTQLHLHLHSQKVLTGKTISDTVRDALSEYFEATSARSEAEGSA